MRMHRQQGNQDFWLRFLILPKAWSVRSQLLTKNATENTQECCFIIFFYRESYLMSNGIQAYENGDGACFLSSGALTHSSRDLFSEGRYSFIGESAQSSCLRGYFISSRVQYAEDNFLCTRKYQKQIDLAYGDCTRSTSGSPNPNCPTETNPDWSIKIPCTLRVCKK